MNQRSAIDAQWQLPSFDTRLGQRIIALNIWAMRQGLGGAATEALFGELCRSLVAADVPLSRAFAGMRTLHPQWGGYGYTWRRQLNTLEPRQFVRGDEYEGGILGGINWSSQHNREEGCDGRETAVGSSVTGQVEVARAAGDRAT